MGVPHHPINKSPPEYLCWRDPVQDQMLARGYISDNWHFPDAEFQQIVEGMTRLKPACDELATASAGNNMASMQEIDEAVLQLVKDYGKKLANTIRTNNHVPPPGPGVPPAQVIVRPMLRPLNAPPQCQWSIATAVVPNAGQCSRASPKRTCSRGESPSSEHCRTTEQWPSWPKCSAGKCSWASTKRTCSLGESPSSEHCRTSRPGRSRSSERSSTPRPC